jgi:hypothetical protein
MSRTNPARGRQAPSAASVATSVDRVEPLP